MWIVSSETTASALLSPKNRHHLQWLGLGACNSLCILYIFLFHESNINKTRMAPKIVQFSTPKPKTNNIKVIAWAFIQWGISGQEMGIPDHLTCLLRNLYAGQEETVKTGHGTTDSFSRLGKEYIEVVFCHPAYLTYMQSTSCEIPWWMRHRLESK